MTVAPISRWSRSVSWRERKGRKEDRGSEDYARLGWTILRREKVKVDWILKGVRCRHSREGKWTRAGSTKGSLRTSSRHRSSSCRAQVFLSYCWTTLTLCSVRWQASNFKFQTSRYSLVASQSSSLLDLRIAMPPPLRYDLLELLCISVSADPLP